MTTRPGAWPRAGWVCSSVFLFGALVGCATARPGRDGGSEGRIDALVGTHGETPDGSAFVADASPYLPFDAAPLPPPDAGPCTPGQRLGSCKVCGQNGEVVMPAEDEAMQRAAQGDMYRESVLPVIEAGQAELVTPGHGLGDHVTLIPTPGHTPGHVSVRVSSGGAEAIITGDAIHTTAQCSHPEWHFRFDADAEQAVTSRRFLLETASERACLVLGSHFSLPSVGRVRAAGDAFRWEPQ